MEMYAPKTVCIVPLPFKSMVWKICLNFCSVLRFEAVTLQLVIYYVYLCMNCR